VNLRVVICKDQRQTELFMECVWSQSVVWLVFNLKALLPFHLLRWAKLSTLYVTEKKKIVSCFHTKFFSGSFFRQKQLGDLCENSIKVYLIETDFVDVNCI
jgi:hypothetical protein